MTGAETPSFVQPPPERYVDRREPRAAPPRLRRHFVWALIAAAKDIAGPGNNLELRALAAVSDRIPRSIEEQTRGRRRDIPPTDRPRRRRQTAHGLRRIGAL